MQATNTYFIPKDVRESPPSKGPEEDKFFLKVVAQLKVEGNFSNIFVERLYDPRVGRMYLIGCRDVSAPWNVLHETIWKMVWFS